MSPIPPAPAATATPASHSSLLRNFVTPLQSSRYDLVKESPSPSKPKVFPPGPWITSNTELDRYMHDLADLPPGWKQHVHVDGKPYFQRSDWGVVTEAYVRDDTVRAKLESFYHKVNAVRSARFPQIDRCELYLTLDPKPGYYFVDHRLHSVFWLDGIPLTQLGLSEHSPAMSFELFIEQNYYCHLENFPIHNELPDEAEEHLRGALIHACTEHMTSRDSATTPWNAQDCKTFLDLLGGLENATPVTKGYKTWFVSRLLCNIFRTRWMYRYGMHAACTDRLASRDLQPPRTMLDKLGELMSGIVFFSVPNTYVDRLEMLWADRIVSLDGWQKLLTSLLVEWSDTNLLATVTLSANMAFLALDNNVTSVSRTASITSTLLAIGSIVIGLHHVWRHRVKVDSTAQQATIYLENATSTICSLNFLALFLSLPLVLLSWSLLTFAFSITWYAFVYGTPPWWNDSAVSVVLILVVGVVVSSFLFFWGIFRRSSQGYRCCSLRALWHELIKGRYPSKNNSHP